MSDTHFLSGYSHFLDSSGGHLTYAAVSTYLNADSELSKKETAFLKEHIASCAHCAAISEEVRDIEEGITNGQIRNILQFLPMYFRHSIAAVLVIGIGISLFSFLQDRPAQRVADNIRIDHSLTESLPDPLRFVPNQTLENFIGRSVRSSRGILKFTPENGDTVTGRVFLSWKREKRIASSTVSIVDNGNKELWRTNTTLSKADVHTQLKPGLYYVKLEMKGEPLFVTKFVIAK